MLEPSAGIITMDGIDLSSVPHSTARERIICLPQDPILFPRTFQFNIDPGKYMEAQPEQLVNVLKVVGLWDLAEKRGGLSGELEPQSLSHGEKQLLALARAIVRRRFYQGRCILILDEATSSLDDESQAKFQEIIETEFKENTVISVAHRLETLRNADEILVLDHGKVARIGTPEDVL